MKVSMLLAATLFVLGSASSGRAFQISFVEPDVEDAPVVVTTDISNALVTTDVENATVKADVPGVPFPATPNIKLFSDILLTEPDGTPSDYLSVLIEPLPATPGLGLQSMITVTFESDVPGGTLNIGFEGLVFPLDIFARSE